VHRHLVRAAEGQPSISAITTDKTGHEISSRRGQYVARRRHLLQSTARAEDRDVVAQFDGFVGADRGYRGLQFFHATGLPLHGIRHVGEPEIDALSLAPGDWVLVTRPDGTPYAWINAEGVELHRSGSSLYDSTIAGGSLFRPDGTLRLALDAALSSPAGLGVAVDGGGQVIGGVRADDVLEALDSQRTAQQGGSGGAGAQRLGGEELAKCGICSPTSTTCGR
jgi:hypothetical protein